MEKCRNNEKPILAIYDVTGIQEYIFSSSKLSDNAGASIIVGKVLREQLPDILMKVAREEGKKTALDWDKSKKFLFDKDFDLISEVIYIGGGNAIVVYRNIEIYERVNKQLAKSLLETSYTLTMATSFIETDFTDFGKDRRKLDIKLAKVKEGMLRQKPMGAIPIVEQDPFTGLPVTVNYNKEDCSTLQMLKADMYRTVKGEPQQIVRKKLPEGLSFGLYLEDMVSQRGEDAYMAVIHIDGNGMGQAIRNKVDELKEYNSSVPEMRTLSAKISDMYQDIFCHIVNKISERMVGDQKRIQIRPLIMEGDDLTFVCKGEWGIPIAAAFLYLLGKEKYLELDFSACAGIALVHNHFPFNIAYEIAEECCHNAKTKRIEVGDQEGYLDFQLVRGSYTKNGDQPYNATTGESYAKRPYRIDREINWSGEKINVEDDKSYNNFDKLMSKLPESTEKEKESTWPRSRLKKLYESYLLGDASVKNTLEEFKSRGYTLDSLLTTVSGDASVFDALELMDIYDRSLFAELVDTGLGEKKR